MPLRGEQRALLQLLCERGQSYEDISGLLGKPAEQVRADARAALEEIGGSDPDAEVGLTDFLLGQADPIGRADATRHLQASPEALDLAKRIEAGLRLLAPEAKLPNLPEPRGKRARAALPAAGEGDESAREARAEPIAADRGSSGPQGRLIAILAAAGVILIAAILTISGVFSSDDDSGAETTATTTASSSKRETVALRPVDGSGVGGTVTFSIVNGASQPQPVADVDLDGIPPPTDEEATLMWIMVGDSAGYPLSTPLVPDKNGSVSGSVAIPADISSIFSGQVTSIRVSSTNIKDVQDAVRQALKEGGALLPFTGKALAEGKISNG